MATVSSVVSQPTPHFWGTGSIPRKPVGGGIAAATSFEAGLEERNAPDFTSQRPPATPKAEHDVTATQANSGDRKTSTSNAHELQLREHRAQLHEQDRYVHWGIAWRYPSYMVLWALSGIGFALGHHVYYLSLDGQAAGLSSRQSWSVRFGTAFAFLVVSSLRAACESAYKQMIWNLFKRKSFSLDTIDKIFATTSDPTALLSWELLRHAKSALAVATVCWCVAVAGVTPPGTLSVVRGFKNETRPTSLASVDWTSFNFRDNDTSNSGQVPKNEVFRIATLAAQSMTILPVTPPAKDSAFQMQFFGPTIQCSLANSTQQSVFNKYTNEFANDLFGIIVTASSFNSGALTWKSQLSPFNQPLMSVYSAFSPYLGSRGWVGPPDTSVLVSSDHSTDALNNSVPSIREEFQGYVSLPGSNNSMVLQKLWIQTADQEMVCILGNASFDVVFEFGNFTPNIAQYSVSKFVPLWVPLIGLDLDSPAMWTFTEWNKFNSYLETYRAVSSLLTGNVTVVLDSEWDMSRKTLDRVFPGNVILNEVSSNVLQHGLSACDDFIRGYWSGDNVVGIGKDGPVPWRQAISRFEFNEEGRFVATSDRIQNITNKIFTKPSWMCRNRTLLKAVEDLFNNITISMLSSPYLTKQNATIVNVTYFYEQNIYNYDSQNLIISYSVAIFFTLLCVCTGFFALQFNGVVHSTAFSAIIATTRNPELDKLSVGHSLGAMPLKHTNVRLRFGELTGDREKDWNSGSDGNGTGRHIGFGLAENVVDLVKGQKYT
ncbi:hypothetical protein BCR34DRAFT_289978 [Clohesyomyces aquaticus]|uniref:Uncharacterized protein n=1 Tax=Clohesyomyces aquaticus TaxID=1231657 RepID=A0A1Y1ZQZ1_9PLEO|nr:hypothetical protein BCR34DRAFT_289978 [Clohesyomyces aquaticus]